MNNIQFNANNLNLLQNSEEFKVILYRFSSNMYELARDNQPVLLITTLILFLVFTTLVYYFDSKKVKSQKNVKFDEIINNEEESFEKNISSDKVELNFMDIKSEINELKKELELLKVNGLLYNTSKCSNLNDENNEIKNGNASSNSTNLDSHQYSDSDEESDTDNSNKFDKTNIQNSISNMSTQEIESLLQICSNYVLIPNWYTKEDFEGLTNAKLSERAWNKILSGNEEYSSLIDETNAMTVSWFENNILNTIEKLPFSVSSIEDSDIEESSNSEESDSDEDEVNLLENDDSDEYEDENNSDEESDNEQDTSVNNDTLEKSPNLFIIKQLEKLKYLQLKKIVGVSHNKFTKKELINLIAKDYNKVSIIKALKFLS